MTQIQQLWKLYFQILSLIKVQTIILDELFKMDGEESDNAFFQGQSNLNILNDRLNNVKKALKIMLKKSEISN